MQLDIQRVKSVHKNFVKKFKFAEDQSGVRENVEAVLKETKDDNVAVYMVFDIGESPAKVLGLFALSFRQIGKNLCIYLDCLFVSVDYRKTSIADTGLRLSDYILAYIKDMAARVHACIPIRLVVLEPAHPKLEAFYKAREFQELPHPEGRKHGAEKYLYYVIES